MATKYRSWRSSTIRNPYSNPSDIVLVGIPGSKQNGATMPIYRSRTSTAGRNNAGARSLWRATGMKDADFEKPIIAVANSFTQFVHGHVHLHDVGQRVKKVIDAAGGWGVEFS